MGLRETANTHLGLILQDSTLGFGWPITLTDPAGLSQSLVGFSTDIEQAIDPETGETITGRQASVGLYNKAITAAGFTTRPKGVADSTSKPWLVQFDDIDGIAYTFKVSSSRPDRAAGMILLMLEYYKIA